MTTRSIAAVIATTTIGLAFLAAQAFAAEGSAVRVLCSNGMKAAMEELQPACERAIGHPLALQFSSTLALKKRIEGGEAFDVAIFTPEAIADLVKQGKIAADSRVDIARSDLGIGIRQGAAKPDIRTPEALKQTLRKAKSITYPQDGASRGFIEKMFERMGIAADLKPRIILAPGSGPATESVAAGKAEMVVTLFSEIVPIKGVEILGALPGEYQYYVSFAAAASPSARDAKAAKALISFLAGSKAAPILKAKGLEPASK